MTPDAVEAKYGVAAGALPGPRGARRGDAATTCRASPASARRRPPSGSPPYDGLDGRPRRRGPDRRARRGSRCASTSTRCGSTASSTACSTDLELPLGPEDLAVRPWDREAMHRVFDELRVPRAARPAVRDAARRGRRGPGTRGGSSSTSRPRRRRARRLARRPRGPAARASTCAASGAPGRRRRLGHRARGRRRAGASRSTSPRSTPADETALAAWLADPAAPKVVHAAKEAWHALGGPRAAARRRRVRHRARRLPVPARPARLRPGRPRDRLPAPRARARTRRRRRRRARSTSSSTAPTRAAAPPCAPRRSRDLADVLGGELADRGAAGLLDDARAAAGRRAGADGAHGHRGRRRLPRRASRSRSTAQVAGRRGRGVRGDRARGEPRLAQAAPGGPLRPAGHAEDQEDQDRATPPTPRRSRTCSPAPQHPFLEHLLAHRDAIRLRQTVEGLLRSVAADGRIHTTFQQTIAATGRLSSTDPNLQNIPIRTEAGRQIRRAFVVGDGLRDAADGRLLADRDADHGAPVGRRGPDRGVPLGRGPAQLRRLARVRRADRRGHAGDALEDQGDELRPGVRAVVVRPVAAARASRSARPRR